MNEIEIKRRLLVAEAERWVGTMEQGNNTGEIVTMFQRWDNSPDHLAWCCSFVQFCLKETDLLFDKIVAQESIMKHRIFKTESCMQMWNNTSTQQRLVGPEIGSLVVWQHWKDGKSTASGHTGIVTEAHANYFMTIEGNTSDGSGIDREGDGVFRKRRTLNSSPNFKLLGFLRAW